MNRNIIVCDTGALISLEKIDNGYRFIRRLYDTLIVPPAVFEEASVGWVEARPDGGFRHGLSRAETHRLGVGVVDDGFRRG